MTNVETAKFFVKISRMSDTQTREIIEAIKSLPSEKVAEVRDFALFLRERYGKNETIDESGEWTDEDLRDVANASLNYADEVTE
jgi:hypothetical protein